MTEPAFEVQEVSVGPVGSEVRVAGRLTYEVCVRLREELARVIRVPSVTRLDLSGVKELDGGAAAVLAEAWSSARRGGAALSFVGAKGPVKSILDLYTGRMGRACLRPPPVHQGVFEQIGRETLRLVDLLRQVLTFIGGCGTSLMKACRSPRSVHWRDVTRLLEHHGADGVPIVLLIALLIGLITAFQAAIQLRQFGADSLLADFVSLSITRELAPLMTAIVVAGRSGAAIAAEMATMRVSEEIDALHTLGLDPYRFLVFPRVLALVIVVPLLTLLADLVGVTGGLLIAISQLEVSRQSYALSVVEALDLWDVMGGVLKGVVFGTLIALIACERGLAARGGAEGVGRATTSAVVSILSTLVLTDALFSILFDLYGI